MHKVMTWRPPLWMVVLIVTVTLAFGSGFGYVRGQEQNGVCTESQEVCADFSRFWEVWNLAEERFVDPKAVDPDEMIAGAINGMLDSLGDQGHTRYLTAEQVKRFNEGLQGSFEGIGAYVNMEAGMPVIVAPIEGSPAESAGILPGDLILKVDGKATEGMLQDEVISLIRGPKGTEVTLTVQHLGEEATVDITIVRAAVEVPATSFKMLPNNVAHIRLVQFSENAAEDLRGRLREAKAAGARGIILDVRDNPGGIRDQAVEVTSLFVSKGKVVLRESYRDSDEKLYRSEEENPQLDIPMVVLINGGSASSAEIFAGALQDYGRATVIGVPTAGTGTVLSPINLEDGSSLLLGIAQWRTPNGRHLRGEGVSPDINVPLPYGVRPLTPNVSKEMSDAEILQSKDVQLLRALNLLGGVEVSSGPSRFVAR